MARVVDGMPIGPAVSVLTLKPGQIGRVVSNGGTNHDGRFVLGINETFAVNLETGVLVENPNTLVAAYPDHTEILIRPGRPF